jgi:WhiB family redox-sensing transcriptional regulator
MISSDSMKWMERGACNGMDVDLFFPKRGASVTEAKNTCAGCSVRTECLAYAQTHCIKHGIWGGLSEKQRRRVRLDAFKLANIQQTG